MNEIEKIDARVKKELLLKDYKGKDRIVYAEEKRKELEDEKGLIPPFRAKVDTIPTLNWCTDGFRKQQLVIVSGPPKNGKTELCATFTASFIKQQKKCLWLPFEGMYEELFARFDTLDFYIPNYMETGRISWVEDKIIEAKQKYGTEIVFIDNLDFLRDPTAMREMRGISTNYATYVGSLVQSIKEIAVSQNILIFLMSHITKNKWTSNNLPNAEDLRDTGQTAQLADIVMMIIRKRSTQANEVYEGSKAIMGVMENRLNGRTKKIPLNLQGKVFVEIDDTKESVKQNEVEQEWDIP